jgi:S-phase kinase-associated protein 1
MTTNNEFPLLKACQEDTRLVTLISQDGYKETVERHIIGHMKLVTDMLDDADDDDEPQIPLNNITKDVLLKVIEFARNNWNIDEEEIEKPLKSHVEDAISNQNNINFLKSLVKEPENGKDLLPEHVKLLVDLITAANYLNMSNLLNLLAAKIASLIKGKTPEQIRLMLDLEDDLTEQQKQQIREENKWVEES